MITVYKTRDGVTQEMEANEDPDGIAILEKDGWTTTKKTISMPVKDKNDNSSRDS